MKRPHQKQYSRSTIELDLTRIQHLSKERDDENWKFRSWLKQYAPDDIDHIVKAISRKYFALIDCKQCANCCRSLKLELAESELYTIAKTLGQSIVAFEKKSISEGMVNPPAPCSTVICVPFTRTAQKFAGPTLYNKTDGCDRESFYLPNRIQRI
jgi:hypothetical protein